MKKTDSQVRDSLILDLQLDIIELKRLKTLDKNSRQAQDQHDYLFGTIAFLYLHKYIDHNDYLLVKSEIIDAIH